MGRGRNEPRGSGRSARLGPAIRPIGERYSREKTELVSIISAIGCPYFRRAFGWCVPIGGLGGLIGLGGGEFRLPVLMYGIGFDARSAVPLNLVTSLVTLTFALAFRSGAVSLGAVVPYLPAMLGLVAGGMASAIVGARFVSRLTDRRLVRLIAILLGMLGLLLMTESFLP